ncbi:MAG: SCP2 sterol-binding domain-containing protein [Microthrixaceae bacterium]
MAKYQFLTEEWIEAAKQIRDELEGDVPAPPHAVKMNLNITEVPFGDGEVTAHMDSSGGEMVMDLGHMDDPELTVTLDYATAKAILVDQNPQAGMQAFMAGKVKVQGDMTKLMAMQAGGGDAGLQAKVTEAIQEITAE